MIENHSAAAAAIEEIQERDMYWIKRDKEGIYRIMPRQGSYYRPMTNTWLYYLQGGKFGTREFTDETEKSLHVKVYQNGTKSFHACHRDRDRRKRSIHIGRFPDITVEHARGMAVVINSLRAAGIDPQSHLQKLGLIPKTRQR